MHRTGGGTWSAHFPHAPVMRLAEAERAIEAPRAAQLQSCIKSILLSLHHIHDPVIASCSCSKGWSVQTLCVECR